MAAGTMRWFDPSKGFGFTASDGGSTAVFVPRSVTRGGGCAELSPGQKVQALV